ncbi:MAG: cupin domain-containing protein [Phycisphaerae bacterium]|nr:cupin domain-containing protein [Phycisphaerae bacterium]
MKYKVYNPEDIMPFGGGQYETRLLLDNYMAGEKAVNVNHGTVSPGGGTEAPGSPGVAHETAEVYFGVSGEADVYLDGQPVYMKQGTLLYIPGGTRHYIRNRSQTEPFVLVTIWPDEEKNKTHAARVKAWGTSYRRADGSPGVV